MSASKLHPNSWNGEERSGGYIAKNNKPTSANSPDYKGRLYLIGVGWFWLSAWTKGSRNGELLSLRVQEMTDEQAEKFCKPKNANPGKGQSSARQHVPPASHNGADATDGDIPF